MDSPKQRAIELKLKGLTYAEIGKELGFSRQRAQQLVRPPQEIYSYVRSKAKFKCEGCAVRLESGHVHHVDNTENYNDVDNLEYLCAACHSQKHSDNFGDREGSGPKLKLQFSEADHVLVGRLEKKLGVKWYALLRMGLRKLAEAEGLR